MSNQTAQQLQDDTQNQSSLSLNNTEVAEAIGNEDESEDNCIDAAQAELNYTVGSQEAQNFPASVVPPNMELQNFCWWDDKEKKYKCI
ncbi:MAG: hypothetical protein ACSI46_19135 [Gloeotrichia echinulata DVL01]|jgi:hypothetical protein|nr:hypothetical protein [Gloeotrichia echinulata DEX184]